MKLLSPYTQFDNFAYGRYTISNIEAGYIYSIENLWRCVVLQLDVFTTQYDPYNNKMGKNKTYCFKFLAENALDKIFISSGYTLCNDINIWNKYKLLY